jgi:hypothetical protein
MTAFASSRAESTASCGCKPSKAIDYAERYPLILEAISRLKVSSIVIDGEAMCFSGAMHDFDKLWNRTHDHEVKLFAFDLLELDGEDYRRKPLTERKKMLFKLLRRAWRGIEYVEHLEGDGSVIFEHACKARAGRHRLQAGRPTLPARPVKKLGQSQERDAR